MNKKLLSLLSIFLLVLSLPMAAQQRKFRIVEFREDPLDLTAVEHEKLDGNGDRYAVIKVSSDNPDENLNEYLFNFGYLNHIVEAHDTELWIYVQRNAKRVTIQRSGFQTVKDYDLKTTIMPGKTYVMTLSAEVQKVLKQMVRFNIEPKGIQASVSIRRDGGKGQEEILGFVDPTTGALAKPMELGSYFYVVRSPDYYDSDGMLTLNDQRQQHIENVRLRGQFGNVTLRVSQNADIYVDDEKKGTREWTGNLRAGNHVVECRQANHKSSQQYVSVNEGETKTFDLTPPTPITGLLSLISTPLDADISIDGKSYGKTPNMIPDLLVGTHALTLSKSGYQNLSQQVEIKEEQTTELNLTLQKGVQQANQNSTTGADIETFTVNNRGRKVSFKMIHVKAGTFQMGSTTGENDEKPVHSVTLTNDYYIGETEVTQELWEVVMGKNPSNFKNPQNPVERVSWNDCQKFINKLNKLTKRNFRLPDEAEWEYAAHGGSKNDNYTYSGSNNLKDVAWYGENSGRRTQPVKTKLPNELGIYDMCGNVWEWCKDWYDSSYYQNALPTNPTGPATGSARLRRGGGWNDNNTVCRSSYRGYLTPSCKYTNLGFRLAL